MMTLGIDIGGTRLKAGLVDADGSIAEARAVPTPRGLEEFRETIGRIAGDLGCAGGVGIGCKGIIQPETTLVEILPGTLHYLEGLRLASFFPEGTRVIADNDARAAMAGEMAWGAARGVRNAIMLTLGTGVGGAIVTEGRLLRGANGVAGHIGHMTVDPWGAPCICGNHGCLETVFSAQAIEAEAIAAVRRGCGSMLTDCYAGDPQRITCQDVFAIAARGDEVARAIRDGAIQRLGAAVAGLLHILDPELLIIGGLVASAGAALFDPLMAEIQWRTRLMLRGRVRLARPQVEDKAGIAGAAAMVLSS